MRGNGFDNEGFDNEVAIIGTGFSGMAAAIALDRAGIEDFCLLEKAVDVGGTWRDNQYPGACCDVPSHLYCFSYEPNPDWTRRFAPAREIHAYQRHVMHAYDLCDRHAGRLSVPSAPETSLLSARKSRHRSCTWRAETVRLKKRDAVSGAWWASSTMKAPAPGSTSPKPLCLMAMSANSRW